MIPLDHFSDEPGCRVGYFSPEGSGEKRGKDFSQRAQRNDAAKRNGGVGRKKERTMFNCPEGSLMVKVEGGVRR